jgi:uncharacterized membrane protein
MMTAAGAHVIGEGAFPGTAARRMLIAACALMLAGILLAPSLPTLYLVYSQICHQQPERSFQLSGAPLGVCARCVGFYAGLFLAFAAPLVISGRWRRWVRGAVLLLALLTLVDILLQFSGVTLRALLMLALVWPALSLLQTLPGTSTIPNQDAATY